MNLTTKLAELMDVWPETTVTYAQDKSGNVFPFTDAPTWDGEEWVGDVDGNPRAYVHEIALSDNYDSEIVTKEAWEAARVAK